MAEKERLEKELAEAEKNRTGSASPHHTAFVPHVEKSSEEGYIDLDETEFDVVGHQEPLSDTRVHETPLNETSITKSTDQHGIASGEQNVHWEIVTELRDRIARDFTHVADIVFPKVIRGPVKFILRSAGKVAKQMAMDLYDFVKRHVKAFIEKRQNRANESTTDNNNNNNNKQADALTLSSGRRDYTE